MHLYAAVRLFSSAWICSFLCTRVSGVCFRRLQFSVIPRGQLQQSRCSFIPRWEYWAIWNCSYHTYWTIALIAGRVSVHSLSKAGGGTEITKHKATGNSTIHSALKWIEIDFNLSVLLHSKRLIINYWYTKHKCQIFEGNSQETILSFSLDP